MNICTHRIDRENGNWKMGKITKEITLKMLYIVYVCIYKCISICNIITYIYYYIITSRMRKYTSSLFYFFLSIVIWKIFFHFFYFDFGFFIFFFYVSLNFLLFNKLFLFISYFVKCIHLTFFLFLIGRFICFHMKKR